MTKVLLIQQKEIAKCKKEKCGLLEGLPYRLCLYYVKGDGCDC